MKKPYLVREIQSFVDAGQQLGLKVNFKSKEFNNNKDLEDFWEYVSHKLSTRNNHSNGMLTPQN